MGFKAITINTPSTDPAHIYSADDATLYNGIIGVDCVLDLGSKMTASIISNNLIRIADGACVIQGHFGRIPFGEYEDMIIENGIADQMRNDIIVARFTTTSSGEVETYELVVLKGVSGVSATDPDITIGDLEEGDYVRELPLYRVKISGLSITEVEPMYRIVPTIESLNNFQTAGGAATAITLNSVIIVDGASKTFIASANNGSAATTINSKPLYKPGTTTAPNLVAGKAYTVWYDLAGDCFFIKASAEGDVVAANVLADKTFSNDNDTGITGAMPNNGAVIITPGTANKPIALGYHDGQGYVAGDPDLISANIKAGANIFGVAGNANVVDTSAGDALASHILSGKKAFVDGALVTGNIPSKGAATITPGTTNQTIAAGQYLSGIQTVLGDTDLIAANILSGKNIFGVAGSAIEGKRFASGTITSPNNFCAPINIDGTATAQMESITVTGLNFTPSYIIARSFLSGYGNITVYSTLPNSEYANGKVVYVAVYSLTTPGTLSTYAFKGDVAPVSITSTGFTIPVMAFNQLYSWIAFE